MNLTLSRKFLPGIAALFVAGLIARPGFAATDDDVRRDATVRAVEQVMPSVVNIATRTVVPVRDPFEAFFRRFYGQQPSDTSISLGSGVIIDEAGYLLTNDHVVRRADQIQIKFNTGTNIYEATVVASDPKRDVALLKINPRPGDSIRAIRMAREDDLLLGETVLALGNPFGLGGSVTRGILSSRSRNIPKEGAVLDIPNWLQTDAPINQGNSGGPLINLRGELIGLNVAVLSQVNGEPAQGIGFAIPIRLVQEALADILPTEFVKSYWLGARVKVGALPLVISTVQPESPAGRAGLRAGDAILQVNGKAPKSFIDFAELLAAGGGSDVSFQIQRGTAEPRSVNVRLVPTASVFNTDMIRRRTGLTLEPLTASLERRYGVRAAEAFVITGVEERSPAENAGLRNGMLVTGFDGQMPQDLTEAAKTIHSKQRGEKVRVDIAFIQRSGNISVLRQAAVELAMR